MGLYGGGLSAKHIALPRCQYHFEFERLLKGEETFPPRLKCLPGEEFSVPLGPNVWKGVGLEEGGCGNGRKEIFRERGSRRAPTSSGRPRAH